MSEFLKGRRLPIIIAEIGAKYAEIDVLEEMVRTAADCGADFVKFQTFSAENLAMPGSFFARADGSKISQFDFFKAHELSRDDHERLISLCRDIGVGWTSTPSHPDDVNLLETFGPPAYKTGSDDLTNLPLLKCIAATGRPMIVSTGMSSLDEVREAVDTIRGAGNDDIILLHCVVSYPAKPEDANLRAIETLRAEFGLPVGLSDHTSDEFTSVLATQLGAAVIEKHFTPDHALELPDHEASLDPEAFRMLVERVHLVGAALGDGVKRVLVTEESWRAAARKSIFSATAIPKGKTITAADLAIRRPADGIPPRDFDRLVGRVAKTDIAANQLIDWGMV